MEITITDRGSLLNIIVDGVSHLRNKKDLNSEYNSPHLELSYKEKRIFRISDHTVVVSPSSTSMTDLENQLSDLLNTAAASGGGGGEDFPIA